MGADDMIVGSRMKFYVEEDRGKTVATYIEVMEKGTGELPAELKGRGKGKDDDKGKGKSKGKDEWDFKGYKGKDDWGSGKGKGSAGSPPGSWYFLPGGACGYRDQRRGGF